MRCGLLQSLTPDATQLSDPKWVPRSFPGVNRGQCTHWNEAAQLAKEGHINALKLMAIDVVMATNDGKERYSPVSLPV